MTGKLVCCLAALLLITQVSAQCGFFDNSYYDENLLAWNIEGDTGSWTFTGDPVKNNGQQNTNTQLPTYLTTQRGDTTSILGLVTVTTAEDDDFIGLVFADGAEAIIFSWKQATQTLSSQCSRAGIAANQATLGTRLQYTTTYGVSTFSDAAMCQYWAGSGPVTNLGRGINYPATGWADRTTYKFRANYSPYLIEIFINDRLEFSYSLDDLIAAGLSTKLPIDKIGFYGFSQKGVLYQSIRMLSIASIAACEPATYRTNFDPGSCDYATFTARVDWGDGTIEDINAQPADVDDPNPFFDLSHFYGTVGTFTVTITLYQNDVAVTPAATETLQVQSYPPLDAQISFTADPGALCGADVTCTGAGGTLNIDYVQDGGGGPYLAYWEDEGSGASFDPLVTTSRTINRGGSYKLVVSDYSSCVFETAALDVTDSTGSTLSLDPQCGSITAAADCGTGSFVWADSTTTAATRTNLPQGSYTVTVTDANGCTDTPKTVTIVDQSPTALCQSITHDAGASGPFTVTPAMIDNGSSDPCGMLSLSVSGFTGGDCSSIGTHSSVLTASGYYDFTPDSCTATVTVVDNTRPTAVCNTFTANFPSSGSYTLDPSDLASGSSDTCGSVSFAADQTVFNNPGQYSVTVTVSDSNGNQNTCVGTLELTGLSITSPAENDVVYMYIPFTIGVSYYLPSDSTMTLYVVEYPSGDVYTTITAADLASNPEVVFFKVLPGVFQIYAESDQTNVPSWNSPRFRLCVTPYAACDYVI